MNILQCCKTVINLNYKEIQSKQVKNSFSFPFKFGGYNSSGVFPFAKRALVPKRYRYVRLTNVLYLKNSISNTQYSSCFGN